MKISDSIYIHYGNNKFDKNRFIEIENNEWVKPIGGLWASNINAEYGWKDWCKENNFRECKKDNSFKFRLKDGSKVLIIDSASKLLDLPKQETKYNFSWVNLDFEQIAKDYDAIEVLISKDSQLYWDLYGWDCDSVLVLNPDNIEIIKVEV